MILTPVIATVVGSVATLTVGVTNVTPGMLDPVASIESAPGSVLDNNELESASIVGVETAVKLSSTEMLALRTVDC